MKLRLDIAAIWLVLLTAPFWLPLVHGYEALGTRVLVLGLAAMSLNFLLGFTGVLSFGHAAYFGLGAYGAGLTLKLLAPSTPLAIVLGMLLGTVAGAALGALIARRRGVYFAMVTIAFGQVFYFIAFRWNALTGGDDGLRGFSRQPIDLGVFTLDILNNLTLSFVISCAFMSMAGTLYALLNNFADPKGLHYTQSGDFVIMAVLGGMRSFWGPLLGAAVFVVLQDYLSSVTTNWQSLIGLMFVVVVLFFPRGLLGFLQRKSQA